jgi:hypothetical protein
VRWTKITDLRRGAFPRAISARQSREQIHKALYLFQEIRNIGGRK